VALVVPHQRVKIYNFLTAISSPFAPEKVKTRGSSQENLATTVLFKTLPSIRDIRSGTQGNTSWNDGIHDPHWKTITYQELSTEDAYHDKMGSSVGSNVHIQMERCLA